MSRIDDDIIRLQEKLATKINEKMSKNKIKVEKLKEKRRAKLEQIEKLKKDVEVIGTTITELEQ